MLTALRDLAPQLVALLLGGLVGSLGPTWVARAARARSGLASLGGVGFAALAGTLAGLGAGGAFLQARRILTRGRAGLETLPPVDLGLFGLLVGLALSLPGLLFVWSEARARRGRVQRTGVATTEERRTFAADLARQIEELSPRPREVRASVAGDGGRVLRLEGELDAAEGDRLTAALRTELSALGFERVEGGARGDVWWSRV